MDPLSLIFAAAGLMFDRLDAAQQDQYNQEQADINREWQQQMIEDQREWDLAMWNRQNEYNSPASQMDRLRAAGLNPNLLYGNSSTSVSGQANSAPTSGSANMALRANATPLGSTAAFTNMFRTMMDNRRTEQDILLSKQQAALLTSQKTQLDMQNRQNAIQDLIYQAAIAKMEGQPIDQDVIDRVLKNSIESTALSVEHSNKLLSAEMAQIDKYGTTHHDPTLTAPPTEIINKTLTAGNLTKSAIAATINHVVNGLREGKTFWEAIEGPSITNRAKKQLRKLKDFYNNDQRTINFLRNFD